MCRATTSAAMLLTLLGLSACNETTPTQPESTDRPSLEAASAAVASNTWLVRADLPSTERVGAAVASVKNASGQSIVYVIGGDAGGAISKVQAYNASTNSWSYKASLPVPVLGSNGAVAIGGKIYISGGRPSSHNVYGSLYVYDPASNSWSRKTDMPNTSYNGVSAAINGKLYVLTYCQDPEHGCYPNGLLRELYRYDPATDRWTTLRSTRADGSIVYHPHGMAAAIGGKLYVVGRQAGSDTETNFLDVYDPASNSWTSRAPMPHPRWDGAGAAVGGKFYVIGGTTERADGTWEQVRTTSVYDPATNTWTNKRAMPSPRGGIGGAAVTVNGQGRVEVVGGARPANNLAYVP
jgi:N-acetylneuraminic acid mutarotase